MTSQDPALIDVTIIGGYLGAGKTTLVNHLLPHLDGRTVVLVNDFGSIGIDGDLIAAEEGDTITLANGCICCSMVDGLSDAIDSIGLMNPRPERLIIETSGVSEPGGVAAYIHVPGFQLDGIVVVVDAESIRMRVDDRYVGDVVRRQLDQADVVVLNKADLLTADALADCQSWMTTMVQRPLTIIPAQHGQVLPEVLTNLGLGLTGPSGATRPTGPTGIYTASFVSALPVDLGSIETWIQELPTLVVRVKGVLQIRGGGPIAIQRVGARVTSSSLNPWPGGDSRMVLISLGAPCDSFAPPGFN
jgi:G3E family GTPase